MKKLVCYVEDIKVDGEPWEVVLIPEGKGSKKVYNAFLSDSVHMKYMTGYYCDQTKAKIDPHVCTPDEIMDLAIDEADDFIGDVKRIGQFEDILFEHFVETDCIRAKNAELYRHN